MEERLNYWLWMHKMFGGTVTGKKLLDRYGDPESVYRAVTGGRELFGIARNTDPEKLRSFTLDDARRLLEDCAAKGRHVISYESEYYPANLRFIKDPPFILFAEGKAEVLKNQRAIAVVGTRNATDSARGTAFRLALNLSVCGALVVSGGADGVDTCAHEGALLSVGGTAAVLGRGFDARTVQKTEFISDKLRNNGVYITEFFPGTESRPFLFPKRNRLISGMSLGVAVVEAPEKSGALITAEFAGKHSRKVFAISPEVLKSPGCEQLLRNGAFPVTTPGDILNVFTDDFPAWSCDEKYLTADIRSDGVEKNIFLKPDEVSREEYEAFCTTDTVSQKTKTGKTKKSVPVSEKKEEPVPAEKPPQELPSSLSGEAKAVYAALTGIPVHMDILQEQTGLDVSAVMCAVTELELEDLARLHPGNRVSLY